MQKRLTQSKINLTLKDVSFTLPPFIRHHLPNNVGLLNATRDRFANTKQSEISIYNYYKFTYDVYDAGVINSMEFKAIRKKLVSSFYSELYKFLITTHFKTLKIDCSINAVLNIPPATLPEGYAEVIAEFIDELEHSNHIREVFTDGKNINYSNCIKTNLGEGNESLLVDLFCSIKNTTVLNQNINRLTTHDIELSTRVLFKIIGAPDSEVDTRSKVLVAQRLLERNDKFATKILDTIDPLIHTSSYERVAQQLPSIYKSLFSDLNSPNHQVNTIGKIRYLSKNDPAKAIPFIQSSLRNGSGSDDAAKRCMTELQNIAMCEAASLLFEYRFNDELSREANKALQIWSSKHPHLITEVYLNIHGQHEQSDLLRIVSDGRGLGNIRALVSLLPVLDHHHFDQTIFLLQSKIVVMNEDTKNSSRTIVGNFLNTINNESWAQGVDSESRIATIKSLLA